MNKIAYALPLILVLFTGFSSSSFSFTFAENYLDVPNNVNSIQADQTDAGDQRDAEQAKIEERRAAEQAKIEERKQQARDELEKQKQQAQDKLEERKIQAQDKLEERKIQSQDKLEERKIQAQDKLEERKQLAREKLEERKQQARDNVEERKQLAREKLEEKRAELREQTRDNVEDRKDAIKQRAAEKRAEIRDNVSDRVDTVRSNVLDKRTDLREKFEDKRDEIKIELRDKAEEKRSEVKIRIEEKRDNIQEFKSEIRERVTDKVQDKVALEIRDKVRDAVKDRVQDKVRDNIRDEIRDKVEYRTDLIKSKIRETGSEEFRKIVLEHKQQIREEAKERIDAIRDKVRSPDLIDQVEDGSYYGDIVELPEEDITNYVLSFSGDAFSTRDESDVKSVSGDVNLELVRLGDSGATLKIIGGQIVIEDAATGELHNVYDIAFGRSRANFDNNSLQITINTVDVDGKPHTFAMRTSMDGIFPTELGGVVDISATDGKSKSGSHWILDFVGTLSVDDPVPITVFEDVEEIAEAEEIIEESIDDCYELTLSDFYTDADLEGLSDEELTELEEDLIAEICAEVGDEVEEGMVIGDST